MSVHHGKYENKQPTFLERSPSGAHAVTFARSAGFHPFRFLNGRACRKEQGMKQLWKNWHVSARYAYRKTVKLVVMMGYFFFFFWDEEGKWKVRLRSSSEAVPEITTGDRRGREHRGPKSQKTKDFSHSAEFFTRSFFFHLSIFFSERSTAMREVSRGDSWHLK